MGVSDLVGILHEAADTALEVIRRPEIRDSRDDVLADRSIDDAVVDLLCANGIEVYSEESGHTRPDRPGRHAVVLDPLDGSRNFKLGVPWYGFSACLLTDGRPEIALVRNLAVAETTVAVRGQGAWSDGRRLRVDPVTEMAAARTLFSGYPAAPIPSAVLRDLGASALDMCAVAAGRFQLSLDLSRSGTESWDHTAGMLIAAEAGATVLTRRSRPGRFGPDLFARRHLVVAAGPELAAQARDWAEEFGPRP
jgi:3'(2'), 5'-bisphosphate nucleotidase